MNNRKPKKMPKPVRAWAYETDHGDLAITTLPSVAREWDQMFCDRGEEPTVSVSIVVTDRRGSEMLRSMRRARKVRRG